MSKQAVDKEVYKRIIKLGRGSVFSVSDFLRLGRPTALRQTLSRLTRAGTIRRVAAALYYYPVSNARLGGELPPSADAVVQAICRRNDSRAIATGALAANLLGLSTQVPAKRHYLTNGPSRTVAAGPFTIILQHVAPRRMAARRKISALVYEALRYMRQQNGMDDAVARLRRTLPAEAKGELHRDLSHAAVWMHPLVERILEKEGT